jgi:hypothetical protein
MVQAPAAVAAVPMVAFAALTNLSVSVMVSFAGVVVVIGAPAWAEKLINVASTRTIKADKAMWYLVTHLVFLGAVGIVLGLLGLPTLMTPMCPLGIFLATILTMTAYHFLMRLEEDIAFDVLLCLITDLIVLLFSPAIYALWMWESGVLIQARLPFKSLLTSMMITSVQALLPLVYFKYIEEPVYIYVAAEAPKAEPAPQPLARPEAEAIKPKIPVACKPYAPERLKLPRIVIALDINGRPVYSDENLSSNE